ncbi:Hypothetical predicted protein [Olea europaea subsp. europaea]|uniref:Uncharacterized protein n=1 Tax=Olea europaea subsp. europaea TaxID=158383 RepID=A0A8S0RTC3_OLEEU|nr:Hypothetical predicted protein [Olea europaea subsp. europaea]
MHKAKHHRSSDLAITYTVGRAMLHCYSYFVLATICDGGGAMVAEVPRVGNGSGWLWAMVDLAVVVEVSFVVVVTGDGPCNDLRWWWCRACKGTSPSEWW